MASDEQPGCGTLREPRLCAQPRCIIVCLFRCAVAILAIVIPAQAGVAQMAAVQSGQATATPEEAFTARDAARLLDQISSGLIDHNRKRILSAFDLTHMTDGELFEQQISSFLAHAGIIRVHYNGIDAGVEEGKPVASVDFELDADLVDDNLPPLRKHARLQLVAEKTPAGWKLIDVQPRSFFSLSQP